MGFSTADIRNLALIGHGGTGKTTLFEQILFNGNAISKAESVDNGKSASDYTEEEIARKLSIHTAMGHVEWGNHKINILDTPGSSDFVGEVITALRAAESALVVVDGRDGVQIETIKLWRRLNERNMPRIVFINRIDRDRVDYAATFASLNDRFNKTFVPVTIPIMTDGSFKGIVNLIENKAYLVHDKNAKDTASDIPDNVHDIVEEARLQLIESAAEGEDSLMEKYFEEGTLTPDEIRTGLISGLRENKIVPTLCGSAELNNGIASLLNFLSNIAPSPSDVNEVIKNAKGEEELLHVDSSAPFSGFVFKTAIDQFAGKMSFVKVVTGKMTGDAEIQNITSNKKERISKIFECIGKNLNDTKEIVTGDIGIITKLESLETNCTIGTAGIEYTFAPLRLPQPVHSLAISASSKKEEDKLNQALHRAVEEDLTLTLNYNKETKENVLSGMGELQINIILDKIKEKQKIEIITKVPRVAYRETITKPAGAEYTHKKQTGGHGQYGRVVMDIKPLPRGEHMQFFNDIKGGSISKGYMPGIEKGILEGMDEGYLAHYPLVDVECHIVDGKEHPVDSSEMAFKLAGKGALKECLAKAGVVLLEPVTNLKVFVEETYMGDILSDLSTRRGRVMGQESLGGDIIEIDAQVPQSELLRYSIDLRSLTSGTGSFEMEFSHYDPISGKIADDVIKASKAMREAEE